jgi:hypothetical protein
VKTIKSMLVGLILVFCAVVIQAQNVCDSVLQYGARNIVSNMTVEKQKSYVFQKACKNRYRDSNSETKLGIEAVIKAVPVGLNFGQSNAQTQIEAWCNQNEKYDDNSFSTDNYENTVFQPSISAWSSCIDATNAGLQVIPSINGDETGITFQVKNTTSDKDVVLQGAAIVDNSLLNSIKCTVKNNQIVEDLTDNKFMPLPPNQAVNVNCQRNIVKVTRNNQEIEILPSGSITLNTKLKNFQMSFLEKSVIQLTDFRANKIEQRLEMLEKQLLVGNGCMRINKTQICWGTATVTEVAGASHVRSFTIVFDKPFAEPPIVTHGINSIGSGHAVAIYSSAVTKANFTGAFNNMNVTGGSLGTTQVTMDYVAIGKAVD